VTCDHILGLEYAICNYVYPVALHGSEQNSWLTVRIVITVWHGGLWFAYCLLRCTTASHGEPTCKFQLGMSLFKTAIQIVLHSCLVIKK